MTERSNGADEQPGRAAVLSRQRLAVVAVGDPGPDAARSVQGAQSPRPVGLVSAFDNSRLSLAGARSLGLALAECLTSGSVRPANRPDIYPL